MYLFIFLKNAYIMCIFVIFHNKNLITTVIKYKIIYRIYDSINNLSNYINKLQKFTYRKAIVVIIVIKCTRRNICHSYVEILQVISYKLYCCSYNQLS